MTDPADIEPSRRRFGAPRWVFVLALSIAVAFHAVGFAFEQIAALRNLWLTLLVALFVAFAMEPVVSRLATRGWRRGTATFLTLAAFVVSFAGLFAMAGAVVVSQGADLAADLPEVISDFAVKGGKMVGVDVDTSMVDARISDIQDRLESKLSGELVSVSGQVAGALINIFTVLFLSFYLCADGPRLRRAACRLVRKERQEQVLTMFNVAIAAAGGYLLSRFILSAISTGVHAAVFFAAGVPYWMPLAIWMGLLSQFIPVIGTYIAAAAPVLVAAANSPDQLIVVVIAIVVFQQIENTLIAPRVVGSAVNIHPALAFCSVLAGATLAGAAGTLIAIPVAATVNGFAAAFWPRHDIDDHDHPLLADQHRPTSRITVIVARFRRRADQPDT